MLRVEHDKRIGKLLIFSDEGYEGSILRVQSVEGGENFIVVRTTPIRDNQRTIAFLRKSFFWLDKMNKNMILSLAGGICAGRWTCANVNKEICKDNILPKKNENFIRCKYYQSEIKEVSHEKFNTGK